MNTSAPDSATELLDATTLRARSRVGSSLRGKWHLDVLLGVGGMGAVYAATNNRTGIRAAVKMLHAELALNTQVTSRFEKEGRASNAIGHDGAVKVLDYDVADDGAPFLVSELLDGETLEDRRMRFGGKLSEDEVLSIADQLLDVLAAAHDKSIWHRDLKNENAFLTRAGQVRVLDFGIARVKELSNASNATRTGATMGTPAMMSPEQARGLWDEVDGRSDLWAVGAMMFVLLSGKPVHEGRTINEILLSAMTKPAPPLASVASGVAPAVAHLVDKALAYERSQRWTDARRMQEAVRHTYYDRYGSPITTRPKLTVPPSVPNRTLPSAGQQPTPPGLAMMHPGSSPSARPPPFAPVALVGAAATTGPVSHSVPGAVSRPAVAAILSGGALLLLVTAGVAVALLVSASRHRGSAASTSATSGASIAAASIAIPPVPSSAPAAAPSASTAPVVAATDLPMAQTGKSSPRPKHASSTPSAATTAPPTPSMLVPAVTPPVTTLVPATMRPRTLEMMRVVPAERRSVAAVAPTREQTRTTAVTVEVRARFHRKRA